MGRQFEPITSRRERGYGYTLTVLSSEEIAEDHEGSDFQEEATLAFYRQNNSNF